jgi:hypothetical protein
MTTVGEISVKISADLAPLRKAQADSKKIMGKMDAALNKSAQTISGAFGQTWGAQVSQFNAGANQITTNAANVGNSFKKTGEAAQKAAKPTSEYASNIKNAGQFSQQAAYQFNDLFVQLASGQSAFTAITQQGAQLSQMFQPGTGLGAAAKGLGSAFVQFLINPLNLAVVAIAGVAAAVPMIWEAVNGSDGKKAEDVLSNLNEVIKEIEKNSPKAAAAIQQILEAAQGNNVLSADLALSRKELQILLNDALKNFDSMARAARGMNPALAAIRSEVKNFVEGIRNGTSTVEAMRDRMAEIILSPSSTEQMVSYAKEIFNASKEAGTLESRLRAVDVATESLPTQSFVDMQQEMENLRLAYEQGMISLQQYNATLATLDSAAVYYQEQAFRNLQQAIDDLDPGPAKDDLQEIYDKAADGELSADQFREAIKQLGLSFDTSGAINSIQGIANAAANAMSTIATLRASGSVLPTLGTLSPLGSAGGVITGDTIAIQNDDASRVKSQTQIEAEKEAKKKKGGGSKGEKDRDYIETLRIETDYLQKQLDLMGLSYEERTRQQAQLEQEKAIKEAIVRLGEKATPEQIAAVKQLIPLQQQLTNELAKQKAVQDTLNDAYVSAAGDIGSAISGAISGTEDLGKAFAKVALKIAEAVIQAQILQSFTGADGKMTQGGGLLSSLVKGIFGGISFDGGGFTGSGARSGGLDGKGGFMAMVHPNETVIDHTKTPGVSIPRTQSRPNVGGGTTQIEVSLKAQTDSSVIMEIADTQIKSRSPAIVKASVQQSQQQTKQNMPGLLANAQARSL